MIHIYTNIGRLGNRIISLINALHLGIHLQMNIYYDPSCCSLNFKSIYNIDIPTVIKITDTSYNTIRYKHNFYFLNNLLKTYPLLQQDIFYKNYKLSLEKLREVIKFPSPLRIYDDNDLHIHIRAGDIFQNWPEKELGLWGVPPPLEYYRQCIQSRKWKNIFIICEDKRNPCLEYLLKEFPNTIWKKQYVRKDIQLILGAKNLVFGQGTFIPSLLLFHDNIKRVYKINCKNPEGINKDYLKTYLRHKNIQSYTYYCDDYFQKMGYFTNNPKQIKLMLTYPKQTNHINFSHKKFFERF